MQLSRDVLTKKHTSHKKDSEASLTSPEEPSSESKSTYYKQLKLWTGLLWQQCPLWEHLTPALLVFVLSSCKRFLGRRAYRHTSFYRLPPQKPTAASILAPLFLWHDCTFITE